MTFEEIREMVNSTITENGQRHITGKSINLALTETLTAIEEFLGTASETIYLPDAISGEMDPEHQAHNLEVYNKFKAAFEGGESLPFLSIDMSPILVAQIEEVLAQSAKVSVHSYCTIVMFIPADSPLAEGLGNGVVFYSIFLDNNSGSFIPIQGLIQPDGNIMLIS